MKIIDIALKDLVRSTRSFFFIGMTLVAPLVITGLIYFAFGGMQSGDVSLNPIQVGIVNADRLPADAPIPDPIGKNVRDMFFDESVKTWIMAFDYPDEATARAALDNQEIDVAVIIPAAFTEKLLADQTDTSILLLQDPTLTITSAW
jgi:ABC-type Na+ efflux pump permease subunit